MKAFVAGGTGFIGEHFVRALLAAGHTVRVLSRGGDVPGRLRALGAEVVAGDLLVPGDWQRSAQEAEWVVHLAQPQAGSVRVSRRHAQRYREQRLRMDRNLLGVLDPAFVRRVVYVSGTSYYGDLGPELHDESATPHPEGWGPYIAPAVETLSIDLARGLPLVIAFPGYVYGDGSWFREYILSALVAEKTISTISGRSRFGSLIHVQDCAGALVHLLTHGVVGERYFVVDDRPLQWVDFYQRAGAALQRRTRLRFIPPWLLHLLLGTVVIETLRTDSRLSNRKLRALGFAHRFPTVDEGLADVVAHMRPFEPR